MVQRIHIVGGGLAGCEAAWQALSAGKAVTLHEMRPTKSTPAHKTGDLAELVCSNSLKSLDLDSAPGLLKSEMQAMDSLIVRAAMEARVPAGQALAVDRERFSQVIGHALESHPRFERIAEEVSAIPPVAELIQRDECWIIATGPLSTPAMTGALEALSPEQGRLYFYDAIAPVLAADSIDMSKCFRASRYGKGDEPSEASGGDYLNIPLTKDQYNAFIDAVAAAEYMPLHEFEDVRYFESCLPIEVMIERGRETLRFGPMKPVGLTDPATGRWPWAAIQLRQENLEGTMYSIVGFQTKMKWPEQKRVFALIPGLEEAEFLRFGSVHRNTYLQSPKVLAEDLSFKLNPRVFLAGQLTGVEGYTESAAMGLLAGRAAAARCQGEQFNMPPADSMIGALARYVTHGGLGDFAPMNANLGLLPACEKRRGEGKPQRKARQCAAARAVFAKYLSRIGVQRGWPASPGS